jgi:acetyltransferase
MSPQIFADVPTPLLCREPHPLDVFVAPSSVAVFGGTEVPGSVGRALMFNLIRHPFGGVLFPISPGRKSVLGVRAYPDLAAAPSPPELAIVATPALTVPDILARCQTAGVKAAIVLSAGFGDSDSAGADLERRARESLQGGPMRLLGMNSFGIVHPGTGFNATFAPSLPLRGKVGFLCQSSSLLTALLNEEHSEGVGCSVCISVGSLVDITWAEWLGYLARDPRTECIGIDMERLDDARAFFAAAREVAAHKPIVLVKGRPAGPEGPVRDQVFAEACRSNGVLLVRELADLFCMAGQLPSRPLPKGRRLAILTNARGPAVLAADALRADGGRLAPLSPETVARLGSGLKGRPDSEGPIDIGEGASSFAQAAVVAGDANVDTLLALLAPQSSVDPLRAAQELRAAAAIGKPVLACWLWGAATPESLAVLRDSNIPNFHSPEAAVRAFGYLYRHAENLRFLAEIREALADAGEEAIEPDSAAGLFAAARRAGRSTLTEAEALELFAAYGLPMQQRRVAGDEAGAVQAADDIGYPVVLELAAGPEGSDGDEAVRLKAGDASGVRRAVRSLQMVASEHFGAQTPAQVTVQPLIPSPAIEASVSAAADHDVGPVLRLGHAGCLDDRAVSALVPLTPLSCREMIEHGPVAALRARHGGKPPGLDALEGFLLQLSRLVVEQRDVREVVVGSLLVWEQGVLARDVRVALHDPLEVQRV